MAKDEYGLTTNQRAFAVEIATYMIGFYLHSLLLFGSCFGRIILRGEVKK